MALKLIDLFAGCGGLGLGFHETGFETILANELNPDPATTYCRNLLNGQEERMLLGPIQEQMSTNAIEMRKIDQIDVDCIAGGPPCQGLSLAGRGDPEDPRNMLFKEYLRVVKKIKPRSILFENVPGFVNRYGLGLKSHLESALTEMGYLFSSDVISASDVVLALLRNLHIKIIASLWSSFMCSIILLDAFISQLGTLLSFI